MRRTWVIARNDLRLFLREKAHYFWLFGSPLLFAFFMGFAMRGPGAPGNAKASMPIENHDTGFVGKVFLDELERHGLTATTGRVDRPARGLRLPEELTARVLAREPTDLQLLTQPGRLDAQSLAELKLFRAVLAFNAHLIEQAAGGEPLTEAGLAGVMARPDPVRLQSSWATRKPMPAGFQQSLPGIMVMFVMMNLLVFGGATVANERREGVLRRLLAQPISMRELVAGKMVGLLLLGAVQVAVFLAVGKFGMGMEYAGNLEWIVLTLAVYAWVAAALGVLAGSLLAEDKVAAVCVLSSMVMAALGGCWWPLEIVPQHVRTLGHAFPSAWAMDALHQLISFGGGWAEIRSEVLVLTGFAVLASWCAYRFFRI